VFSSIISVGVTGKLVLGSVLWAWDYKSPNRKKKELNSLLKVGTYKRDPSKLGKLSNSTNFTIPHGKSTYSAQQ